METNDRYLSGYRKNCILNMLIVKVPLRVSFIGGGTDLQNFYKKYDGQVISTTINKYIYLSLKKSNDEFSYLKYSKFEKVKSFKDIKHPIIRTVFKNYNLNNVDLSCSSDISSGTGLASSSAFTIALLRAVKIYLGYKYNNNSIAEECCDIEIKQLKEPIGKQDQYSISFGGLNRIFFKKNGKTIVKRINKSDKFKKKLSDRCSFAMIGSKRNANIVLREQKDNLTKSKILNLHRKLVSLVPDFNNALLKEDFNELGKIITNGWEIKKNLSSNITNSKINDYIEDSKKNGAIGNKLLGAGKSGCVLSLFNSPLEKRRFIERSKKINFLNIEFVNSNGENYQID